MAKTLADMQTVTRIYLDESQAADYMQSEVNYAINFAYHDVVGAVMEVKEEYYDTITKFQYALVGNQQEYAIDTTIVKVTRVEVNYAPNVSGSQPIKLVPIRSQEMLINLSNTSTATFLGGAGYYLHGKQSNQTIGFIPIPTVSDTGSTKSISVWGLVLPSDLVNSTDTVDIPYADRFSYLVSLKAAAILLSKGQQEEVNADKYFARYEREIEIMKNFLVNRQEDDAEIVIDVELENTDFGFPL